MSVSLLLSVSLLFAIGGIFFFCNKPFVILMTADLHAL